MKSTDDIIRFLSNFLLESPLNKGETDGVNYNYYSEPICAVASSDDPLFQELKKPEIVSPEFLSPLEWMPEAQSVISIFFPLSDHVRNSNYGTGLPSTEWLYARYEGGNQCIPESVKALINAITYAGINVMAPAFDKRFHGIKPFTSNWSERHVAFVAGMGTFGLSRSFITRKGIAGRFSSILIDQQWPVTTRDYSGVYEYCNQCKVCLERCPSGAINLEYKDKAICSEYLDSMKEKYSPRYGCGKCQTNVPCETGIPGRAS